MKMGITVNFTMKDFIESTERMRELQLAYFATRSARTLNEAKDAERRVDALIKVYRRALEEAENPRLF